MKSIKARIKPAVGFSYLIHIGLTILLPALVLLFIKIDLVGVSIALVLLSKWRMFAVKPRHWPANVRANGVDIVVGLSFLVFMTQSSSQFLQLLWVLLYGLWLLVLKPKSDILGVSCQAIVGQFLGLTALFLYYGDANLYILAIGGWIISYVSARHFLTSFEERLTRFMSYVWGYFASAFIWILGHWLIFYGAIAQPTLLISVIGTGVASLYYLHHEDKLSLQFRRQIIFVIIATVAIILIFSDWGDKSI